MAGKFRLRVFPTLGALIGIAILLSLGTWQANRYLWKLEIEERRDQRMAEDAVRISSLEDINNPENDYRHVQAEGKLENSLSVMFKFRTLKGKSGYWVATPLVFDDGSALLVQRGWVPVHVDPKSLQLEEPSLVKGVLFALDRVIPDDLGRESFKEIEPDQWTAWNTFDLDAVYAAWPFKRPDAPAVLVLTENTDADILATVDHVTKPYMTSEKHLGYSITWYTLAACLFGMWLANAFGRLGVRRT